MASVREHVEELIRLVEHGQFLEAIERFYAEDATMQENSRPPRAGLAALLENERKVLVSCQEVRTKHANSFVVDGDRAAIHWEFEFIDFEGRSRRVDEIAYQLWGGGKIIVERFFYDPAPAR
jgi:hypothetical protein